MSYDPDVRHDTPLAERLKARIRRDGPLTVHDVMHACLHDAEHGYYRARRAIGREGDFITGPEISQVFGELIGLWAAVVWRQMGGPSRLNLVEVGPGRGTLMADALRALRIVPDLREGLAVHLVEASPVLGALQRESLRDCGVAVTWHEDLDALGAADEPTWDAPTIVVANELLDTLPGQQHVRVGGRWRLRRVGIDAAGALQFLPSDAEDGPAPVDIDVEAWPGAVEGDIVETQLFGGVQAALCNLGQRAPLAALLIDYGHATPGIGESLQAVRAHRYEHPLTAPGEADLSMQVSFGAFAAGLGDLADAFDVPLAVDGPVPQAELLGALGIAERASRLMGANPAKAGALEAGVARLMAPQGMGTRFKALGIRSAELPPLPGFPHVDRAGPAP